MNDRDFLEACAEALNQLPRRTLSGTGPGGFEDTYQLAAALAAHLGKKSPRRAKGDKTPATAVSAALAQLQEIQDKRAEKRAKGEAALDQAYLQSGNPGFHQQAPDDPSS